MKEKYRLKKIARLVQEKKSVLDLGSVDMPNPFLANKKVIGFDKKNGILTKNYTDFISGDVTNLNLIFKKNSVETIIAGELIEHLENPILFLKKCYQILKKDGTLILSTPNPNSIIERLLTITLSKKYFYTKDHVMLYPQRWLIRILKISGFKKIKLYSGGMITPFSSSLMPFPRAWCYQTIAVAQKLNNK
ncbi:methyltransferase domain-containing protein [Candidatus Woesearchaeota archaeon]|jgi:ubiquinone/menaquinone biosynthesis C-methylase UbiE|nr:methyltransferase domain-containing protein [Candidatus Woesearchaeota archaeon]